MPGIRRGLFLAVLIATVYTAAGLWAMHPEDPHQWNEDDLSSLKGLWIGSLPEMPDDPSNAYANDSRAVSLGKKFFFDTRFSGNKKVSCGTCHQPDYAFTDPLPLAHGMGTTARRTMPILGLAYQSWFFWDGRKDSLWSQALGPLESPVEHGFTRSLCFQVIDEFYRDEYEAVFGPMPDAAMLRPLGRPTPDDARALKAWIQMPPQQRDGINRVYANMGKAIGAYVRTIMPGPSRFDQYVEAALNTDRDLMGTFMNDQEAAGLRLFIGKAGCTNCHNGPMLTNGSFHNVGVPDTNGFDRGRADGITGVLADEFNCMSRYSDAIPTECSELRFIDTDIETYAGAFKTPTLRNVADRSPYMHAGQFGTLREVLEHYRRISKQREGQMHDVSLVHAELTDDELLAIEAFLRALSGPIIEIPPGIQD